MELNDTPSVVFAFVASPYVNTLMHVAMDAKWMGHFERPSLESNLILTHGRLEGWYDQEKCQMVCEVEGCNIRPLLIIRMVPASLARHSFNIQHEGCFSDPIDCTLLSGVQVFSEFLQGRPCPCPSAQDLI